MISAEGARRGRFNPDFVEIRLAMDAGALVLTDIPADRERSYNIGERQPAVPLYWRSSVALRSRFLQSREGRRRLHSGCQFQYLDRAFLTDLSHQLCEVLFGLLLFEFGEPFLALRKVRFCLLQSSPLALDFRHHPSSPISPDFERGW